MTNKGSARSNHTPYHTLDNTQKVPAGTYNGLWTGTVIELERNGEMFTEMNARGINIRVRVEVNERQIKVFLL